MLWQGCITAITLAAPKGVPSNLDSLGGHRATCFAGLQVTLVVPWLAKCDQELTFINGVTFDTPDEQEKFMGEWITKRTNLIPKYKVVWYSGASAHLCKHLSQACELAHLHVTGCTKDLARHMLGRPVTALHLTGSREPAMQD